MQHPTDVWRRAAAAATTAVRGGRTRRDACARGAAGAVSLPCGRNRSVKSPQTVAGSRASPPSRRTHNLIIVGKPDNPEFTHSMLAACMMNLAGRARAVLKLPQVLKNADSDAPSVTLVARGRAAPSAQLQ